MGEHAGIVGRIANKQPFVAARVQVFAQQFGHAQLAHRQLVVQAEPAVDMDRADRGGHAGLAHDGGDAGHGVFRQRRDVFGMVDGEVGGMPGLVRGQRAARHFVHDALAQRVDALQVARARGGIVQEAGLQAAVVQVRVERTVLADDGIDRPQPGQDLGPGDAAPGDRDHVQARAAQAVERQVGRGRQPPVGGQGAVDVGQHAAHAAQRRIRELVQGLHGGPL
ncbi:hypothetical protein AU476_20345 [Cupriavidus sp. UYMSc13B]|nr:hypothetical protein AU476_20345 [Cupriavidus sp. UYMSc13B]